MIGLWPAAGGLSGAVTGALVAQASGDPGNVVEIVGAGTVGAAGVGLIMWFLRSVLAAWLADNRDTREEAAEERRAGRERRERDEAAWAAERADLQRRLAAAEAESARQAGLVLERTEQVIALQAQLLTVSKGPDDGLSR